MIIYKHFEYYDQEDEERYKTCFLKNEQSTFHFITHPIRYYNIRIIINNVDCELFFNNQKTFCYKTRKFFNSVEIEDIENYIIFI